MQFYPHRISSNVVGFAISASIAQSGSLIANFSAIPVNTISTASVALNITGSAGANGTGGSVTGPTGPTGIRGVTGPRGHSVFLLSASWSGSACGGAPVNCYEYQFATVYNIDEMTWTCDFGNPLNIYSTDSPSLTLDVSPLYSNNTCTEPIINSAYVGGYANNVWGTDSYGTGSFVFFCSNSI